MNLFFFKTNFFLLNSKIKYYIHIFFLCLLYLNIKAQSGFEIPPKPKKIYPVQDYANIFNTQEKYNLNNKLLKYKQYTSNEILVITIPSLHHDDINLIAATWGEKWKIGEKEKNNGIIFLISIQEKQVAIQVGRSLEDPITDAVCRKIIKNYFTPYAIEKNFYKATTESINIIQKILFKTNINNTTNQNQNKKSKQFLILLFIILITILLKNKNKDEDSDGYNETLSKKRKKYLNIGLLDFPINDDKSSNDGFGSGGSFGGGGAHGNW